MNETQPGATSAPQRYTGLAFKHPRWVPVPLYQPPLTEHDSSYDSALQFHQPPENKIELTPPGWRGHLSESLCVKEQSPILKIWQELEKSKFMSQEGSEGHKTSTGAGSHGPGMTNQIQCSLCDPPPSISQLLQDGARTPCTVPSPRPSLYRH